ncbi:hypothetical protein D3C81_2114720 [compost metagenome]
MAQPHPVQCGQTAVILQPGLLFSRRSVVVTQQGARIFFGQGSVQRRADDDGPSLLQLSA